MELCGKNKSVKLKVSYFKLFKVAIVDLFVDSWQFCSLGIILLQKDFCVKHI